MNEWLEYIDNVIPINGKKRAITKKKKLLLSNNEVYFNPVLDLHGFCLEQAYRMFLKHIEISKQYDFKYIQVITGKSGEMRREFSSWLNKISYKKLEKLPGDGAFKIYL